MNRLLLYAVLSFLCSCPLAAQWANIGLEGRSVSNIAVSSSGLYALISDSGCVYRSTDAGTNWLQTAQYRGREIAVGPTGIVYGDMFHGDLGTNLVDSLCRSTDGGMSWTNLMIAERLQPLFRGSLHPEPCVAVGPNGVVFSGVFESIGPGAGPTVIATSTDNGSTWVAPAGDSVVGGRGYIFRGHCVVTWGTYFSVVQAQDYLAFSSDDGLTWQTHTPSFRGRTLAWCSNGNILSSWGEGVYLSPDTAVSWSQVSTLGASALLAFPQGGVLVGTDTTGVYLFTDYGESLGTLNEGLTDLHIHTFALDSWCVYVGTNKGIWCRSLNEIDPSTGITRNAVTATTFHLKQNYPNPFNPSTTIEYDVPKPSHVKLTVYDLLGREVSVVVNESKEAGVHRVRFDASGLSSGVYFYRFEARDPLVGSGPWVGSRGVTETKRLMILK